MSPGARRSSATPRASTPRAGRNRRQPSRPPTTCCSGTGSPRRSCAGCDPEASLGITLNLTVADPADPDSADDQDAARRIDGLHNRIFLDPLLRGEYPADVLDDVAGLGFDTVVHDGDLAVISAPIDLLGVNYYQGEALTKTAAPADEPDHAGNRDHDGAGRA